jgi:isocitrate dehydrogenase
MLSRLVT